MSGTTLWMSFQTRYCTIVLLTLVGPFSALGQSEDAWKNLMKVRHDRGYTLLTRNGSCISGSINEANDAVLKIETVLTNGRGIPLGQLALTTIKRPDVLRVSDNPDVLPHDAVYSGRSSWVDVREAHPYPKTEWLKIVLNHGHERPCKRSEVLDDRLTCEPSATPKSEISRVYYVRLKPASSNQLYLGHEGMAWLDARTWFDCALYGRIDVLLYESPSQEDDALVSCKSRPLATPNR